MREEKVFAIRLSGLYPLYLKKVASKDRTRDELDRVIRWLTGYNADGLQRQVASDNDLDTFFAQAPAYHPDASLVRGVVCGVRVEDVEHPLMRKIRTLDKLVDELAKGKAMDKILRR